MRAQEPYVLFRKWVADAVKAGTMLPEAMALATASRKGVPSVRMVLNRGLDHRGFAFFTNYDSPKATDLRSNPRAAVVFHWPLIERQVRAEGRVEKLTRAESDRYFNSRPRESRFSAGISPRVSGGGLRAGEGPVCGKAHTTPAVLGRVPACPGPNRVLAGAALSSSRPRLLSKDGTRLEGRQAGSVTTPD